LHGEQGVYICIVIDFKNKKIAYNPMKKTILSVAVMFSAGFLMAQTEPTTTNTPAPTATEEHSDVAAGATMTFEAMEVDYGTIDQGADPLRIFKFKNSGTEPLLIKKCQGSCGCTVPTWPKEPIMPGETGSIEVRYDTNRVGPFTKNVTVTTNETVGQHILTIKGRVEKKEEAPTVPANTQPNMMNSQGGH
jgi:hypothetical protein